jgi:cytochrome c-type biogenesis protein CcmE
LGRDGVFRATTLLAKCGSRYEAKYDEAGKKV